MYCPGFEFQQRTEFSESVEITNKIKPCNRIYYSNVYWRLNMFRAAHRSSSGALNYLQPLVYIHMWLPAVVKSEWEMDKRRWAVCRSKHVEPSINVGIINSITRFHLVGYFYWFILRCTDPCILTLRLLMSYIYIYIYIYIYAAPILDVSRSHTTTHHSR